MRQGCFVPDVGQEEITGAINASHLSLLKQDKAGDGNVSEFAQF